MRKYRSAPMTRCAGTLGVKRENQMVRFASGKLRVKTIWKVRDTKGTRTGVVAGSNLRVQWTSGVSWNAI